MARETCGGAEERGGCAEWRLSKSACSRVCGRVMEGGDCCEEPCIFSEGHGGFHRFLCQHTLTPPRPQRPPPVDAAVSTRSRLLKRVDARTTAFYRQRVDARTTKVNRQRVDEQTTDPNRKRVDASTTEGNRQRVDAKTTVGNESSADSRCTSRASRGLSAEDAAGGP